MTCIIGMKCTDGRIIMAGDSYAGQDNCRYHFAGYKVFSNRGFLMGQSGTLGQTMRVQHIFVPPTRDAETQSVESYIYGTFTQSLTDLVLVDTQQILMAFAGRLWEFGVEGGKAIAYEPGGTYAAIGSGTEVALGVLRTLISDAPGNELLVIKKAFEAVCHYRSNVAGPFPYLCWSPDGTITSGVL